MHLAYVDESGDGAPVATGGTPTFTLACVLVDGAQWPRVFDDLLDFRRYLKANFGVPVREEVKAQHLIHNKGPFSQLNVGDDARQQIYRSYMRLQPKLGPPRPVAGRLGGIRAHAESMPARAVNVKLRGNLRLAQREKSQRASFRQ